MKGRNTSECSRIGVVIYTYNRVDDAKINMEIIRNIWPRVRLLEQPHIIHMFNGDREWWPEPYLEDELIRMDNYGHYDGASRLIDSGLISCAAKCPDIDYVIVLASDTWCVKPEYLSNTIKAMIDGGKYLASCAWGTNKAANMFRVGFAVDLFVVNVRWAVNAGFVPFRFEDFKKRFGDVIAYRGDVVNLERVVSLRFSQAIARSEPLPSENLLREVSYRHIERMKDREPVHISEIGGWRRIMYHHEIGVLGHHDPQAKRDVCRGWNMTLGTYGKKFMSSESLSYYNSGFISFAYYKSSAPADCKEDP